MSRGARVGLATVAMCLVIVASVVAIGRTIEPGGPAATLKVDAGGFSVWIPEGWKVRERVPGVGESGYLSVAEPGLLGRFPRAGFWVGRWATSTAAPFYGVAAEPARLAGREAGRRTYKKGIGPLPMTDDLGTTTTEYRVVVGAFVYQLGFWTAAGSGDWTKDFARVRASFATFAPGPWRLVVANPAFALTAPPGWTQVKPNPDLQGVAAQLVGPEPVEAWAYVFTRGYRADTGVERAKRALVAGGGYDLTESTDAVAGRSVARLDYRFPTEDHTAANASHNSEWFVPTPRGGFLVLVVGRRSPTSTVGDDIARSFQLETTVHRGR